MTATPPNRPVTKNPLRWRKSTRSSNGSGQCVEVALDSSSILIRDSKQAVGPTLRIDNAEWSRLTRMVGRD